MKTRCIPLSVFAVAAVFATGCASHSSSSKNHSRAGNASTSLRETAVSIDKGEVQIDAVLVALSDLVNNPGDDIKPQFKQFEGAMDKLDALAKDVREQATAMQEQGAAYFQQWEADLVMIEDENIRSRSTGRKNTVAARFDRVRFGYAATNAAFTPFMSRLADVRTALATDLTSGGLSSVRAAADRADSDATPLREALRQLSADFKHLGISLSSAR